MIDLITGAFLVIVTVFILLPALILLISRYIIKKKIEKRMDDIRKRFHGRDLSGDPNPDNMSGVSLEDLMFYFGHTFGMDWSANSNSPENGSDNSSPQNSAPAEKQKKIPADVGEYVDFQEIAVTEYSETSTCSTDGETYTEESRITDVEWEDVPEE